MSFSAKLTNGSKGVQVGRQGQLIGFGDQNRTDRQGSSAMSTRPPVPPFTVESAIEKVRLIEDAWNTRDPEHLALGRVYPQQPLAQPG
jgi:Protein of unknown function (DUF1348)